jgi:hypothetical protein
VDEIEVKEEVMVEVKKAPPVPQTVKLSRLTGIRGNQVRVTDGKTKFWIPANLILENFPDFPKEFELPKRLLKE